MFLRKPSPLKLLLAILTLIVISLYILINSDIRSRELQDTLLSQLHDRSSPENVFPYTIVTAASSNHFCPLLAFVYALHGTTKMLPPAERPRVVVYDLGLSTAERAKLDRVVNRGFAQEIVTLNFTQYPTFWNIHLRRGEYAWKTGIIHEVAKKHGGVVLWMDSGNRVTPQYLPQVVEYINANGFYSPTSQGQMKDFTHPGLFAYFGDSAKRYGTLKNCNGAFIGFDTQNSTVMNKLMLPFFECGLKQPCIAPKGSSRANHRQDQSVFTYLVVSNGWRCQRDPIPGMKIHQDQLCQIEIEQQENPDILEYVD
ncbi:hypothetical protein K493DRAFT_361562 [Basidiobolus meristosporus CBS 931.73]|uniref:Uncharacterized protein n=1 Tax=Basidiobolus meristosporus CBS 931.73 TaxID=1314790 RepID=A0A1Y1X8W6_9FUNG|nr:hypothetical protein K493DRAFT_361562 [Basidiobolus meristosporus CBS 931.73]|eukprot:ORX82158.1 hypothetical protein K493DRAFT_361562 [Basidiobolus meristosporus CBS 931.73]